MKETINDEKQVLVTGLISSGEFHDDSEKNPLPDSYMSESGLPKELIEDVMKNGWLCGDKICFPEDYQPSPVRGKDGNVFLVMNDTTMKDTSVSCGLMMESFVLLNQTKYKFQFQNPG